MEDGLEGLTEIASPERLLMSEASLNAALPDDTSVGTDPFADDSWMDRDDEPGEAPQAGSGDFERR